MRAPPPPQLPKMDRVHLIRSVQLPPIERTQRKKMGAKSTVGPSLARHQRRQRAGMWHEEKRSGLRVGLKMSLARCATKPCTGLEAQWSAKRLLPEQFTQEVSEGADYCTTFVGDRGEGSSSRMSNVGGQRACTADSAAVILFLISLYQYRAGSCSGGLVGSNVESHNPGTTKPNPRKPD